LVHSQKSDKDIQFGVDSKMFDWFCKMAFWILVLYLLKATNVYSSMLLFHGTDTPHSRMSKPQTNNNPNSKRTTYDSPMGVLPPNMPVRFYTDFIIYYTPRDDPRMPLPPWPSVHPPELPYAIGRGRTWYAADLGIMIESYTDYCVPIFEPNSYFPCVMFNYNNTAYFISDKTTGYGPCCVYRKPWAPPHRDFMQQFTHYYNGSTTNLGEGILEQMIDWWIIPQVEGRRINGLPSSVKHDSADHPVFGGYGWAREQLKR
ncbi:uncharacterized protein DEA37_0007491, partial [Paragonimus westermani]